MKEKKSKSYYMAGFLFSLLIALIYLTPALPLFIRCFLPFPKLENTTIYEGTLHIEGSSHRNQFGTAAPNYFIVDKQGVEHKIFWGFIGNEDERFLSGTYRDGSIGKVSYHPIFGVVEEEFVTHTPNEKPDQWKYSYEKRKSNFENYFNFEKYLWKFWPSFTAFVFAYYYFSEYQSLKKPTQENDNG